MCYLLQSSELLLSTRRLRQEKKPIEAAIGPSRFGAWIVSTFWLRQASGMCVGNWYQDFESHFLTIITD